MPTRFSGGADRVGDDHSAIVEGPKRVVATSAASCFRKSPRVWFLSVIAVPWAMGAKKATVGIAKLPVPLAVRKIRLLVQIALHLHGRDGGQVSKRIMQRIDDTSASSWLRQDKNDQ